MARTEYAQGHVNFPTEKEKKDAYDYAKSQGASFSHIARLLFLRARREKWKLDLLQREAHG